MQIRLLREQRGWSQSELARRCGMKQSRISVLEDVNHERWSVTTLRRLARAFDVSLLVRFEDFTTMQRRSQRFTVDSLRADAHKTQAPTEGRKGKR